MGRVAHILVFKELGKERNGMMENAKCKMIAQSPIGLGSIELENYCSLETCNSISVKSIFVDESGTSNLKDTYEKDRLYISAAIIVDTNVVPTLIAELDVISEGFNGGAPLKSSKIGNNEERRVLFLKKIASLSFKYAVLIVDKTKISSERGFVYKTSFYKFMANCLYKQINKKFADIAVDLYADQYGTKEFQESCKKYFDKKCDLFSHARIVYNDDKTLRLIQLADMIAGTFRQYFNETSTPRFKKAVRSLLRSEHEVLLSHYPFDYRASFVGNSTIGAQTPFDKVIAKINIDNAVSYINDNSSSQKENDMMRITVLKMLLESYSEATGNIFLDKIKSKLETIFGHSVQKQYVQSKIIGALRMKGIIIAGEKLGYRLVTSEKSLCAYLTQDKTIILPMLAKLDAARTILGINGNIDILARYPEHAKLKIIADAYKDVRLQEQDAIIMRGRDETIEN